MSSPVHATPLITDFFNDGFKDVLIPGKESLTLISGRSGAIDADFESGSHVHLYSSPLLHDIDFDGVLDVILPNYDGRVEFVKERLEVAAADLAAGKSGGGRRVTFQLRAISLRAERGSRV